MKLAIVDGSRLLQQGQTLTLQRPAARPVLSTQHQTRRPPSFASGRPRVCILSERGAEEDEEDEDVK